MTAGIPFGFGPPASRLRRSVIDPVTGLPVVTSAPTGEVVQRSSVLPVGRDDAGRLTPALPGLVTGALSAAQFPGQVYRGEARLFDPATGHVSDEAVGKAFDLGGLAMTGSLPFSKPAGAIGMFGGRNAKTADLAALSQAEGMAGTGADRRAIWDATGWFQGADRKWRFEIPDDAAAMKGTGSADQIEAKRGAALGRRPGDVTLGDVMRHPQAFAAYPELAETKFSGADLGRGQRGQFDPGDALSNNPDPRITVSSRVPPGSVKSVTTHEGQHDLQGLENFAVGGDPRILASAMPDAAAMNDALVMSTLVRRGTDPDDAPSRFLEMLGRDPHPAARVLIRHHSPAEIAAMPATPQDAYRRLAGEVEARNVQARLEMTPEQRRATPPWLTQDVPDEQQIVQFGRGGPQMSMADDPLAALEAALGAATKDMASEVTPRAFVDPAAKLWDLYHGTASPTDFARFRTDLPESMRPNTVGSSSQGQAVFFSPAPDEAAHYALGRGATGEGVEAGPRSMRVTVDPGKTGVLDMVELAQQPGFADRVFQAQVASYGNPTDPARLRSIRSVVDQMHRSQLDRIASAKAFNEEYGHLGVSETPTYNYLGGGTDVAVQMAREQGLDTAIIRGLSESNGGDQVIALTPGRVRSRYSGDLLYAGAPLAAGAATLAQPDASQAAPSQGASPVSASPFGFGRSSFAGPSDEDLARSLAQTQLGMPTGFSGAPTAGLPQSTPAPMTLPPFGFGRAPMGGMPGHLGPAPGAPAAQPPIAMDEAEVQRLEREMGMVPQRRELAPLPSSPAQSARSPAGARMVPLPPQRPAEFSADLSAEGSRPIIAAASAQPPAAEGPSFFDRLGTGIRNDDGLLLNIGSALMTVPGFGRAIGTGLQNYQAGEGRRAASKLAQAELGLKQQKAAREAQGENQTRALLIRGGQTPEMADGIMAAFAAGDRTALNNALNNIVPKRADAPSGYTLDAATGRASFIPGGPQDPTTIQAQAQARAVENDTPQLVDVPQADGSMRKMWLRKGQTEGQAIGEAKPAAPVVREFTGPDGSKRPHAFDPTTRQWRPLDLGDEGTAPAGNPYATGKFNNDQGKAAGFTDRMMGSEQVLRDLEGINSGFWGGVEGTASGITPNALKSSDRQRFEQAKRDFVNSQLRRESGAAISQKEFDNAAQQYFPQPGDGAEVIEQKRLNRQRAIEAMGREGGPSYRPRSVFDETGAIVPFQPRTTAPAAPSRSALEAEARRRGLIR